MHHKRRPDHEVTPEYEDAGLFRNAVCNVLVSLTPQLRRNDRGDLIVRGFAEEKYEIDVQFAGRRKRDAIPLERKLRQMSGMARRSANADAPAPSDVRLAVQIQGSWRKRLIEDNNGWGTGTHHLVAARWAFTDDSGASLQFGEPAIPRLKLD